jgi:hypothetical protein
MALKLTAGTEGTGKLHVPKEIVDVLPKDEKGKVSIRFKAPRLTEQGILYERAPDEEAPALTDLPDWLKP